MGAVPLAVVGPLVCAVFTECGRFICSACVRLTRVIGVFLFDAHCQSY